MNALTDPAVLPVDTTGSTEVAQIEVLVRRVNDLVALVEPLCWSMQVAARWSDSDGFTVWADALRTVTSRAAQPTSGRSNLIALRFLPALCLTMSGAVAAYTAGRWDVLRDLTTSPIDDGKGRTDALLNVLGPWVPFDNSEYLPNLLARLIGTKHDPATISAGLGNGSIPKKYTPVSDWLLELRRPVLEDQFATDADYERAFDDTELFLGVLSQDLVLQSDSTWRQSSGWFGRYTWRDRHRAKDVVDEFELRVRTAGRAWPPLQAGLFGGDIDRALQAIAAYGEDFKQLQRRRH